MYIAGFDIGGTKCAVLLAQAEGEALRFLFRKEIPTSGTWQEILDQLCALLQGEMRASYPDAVLDSAGVSCGGPLNSARGIICSPPNLPGWDEVPVTEYLSAKLGVPTGLMNDADAGAVAEWRYGAGRGTRNMIFLTFGTGLGAGLILGGRLYSGTNDMAGEAGHIRMAKDGPTGYGKRGSFEGFCSGGGLRQIAQKYAEDAFSAGRTVSFCANKGELSSVTAKKVIECARAGAEDAVSILRECGTNFGRGLAVLIDILNPECIVAGSIFLRAKEFLYEPAMQAIRDEALPASAAVCRLVPAGLGEKIGDYAAIVASPHISK